MTDPIPLAYGLRNPITGRIDISRIRSTEKYAVSLATRWPGLVAIPIYGPEALAAMAENVAMCQRAEAALRAENIELRNQIAIMRGREVAQAHAEGRKAP